MKSVSCKIVGIVVLLVLTSRGRTLGGVVMAETSLAAGAKGSIARNKTLYVQGNKQRIDEEGIAQITDLDKNLVYIIDKNRGVFAEIPLKTLSSDQSENHHLEPILIKTGNIRVVANHLCQEYRAADGNKLERATISACVSTNTPGAKEIAQFDRNMIARLGGHTSEEKSIRSDGAGLILEKTSVLSFRVPDPSRGNADRTTSLVAETRVEKIQSITLPPQTFKPPTGYKKLQNQPDVTHFLGSPESNPALEAIVLPPPASLRRNSQ
ncbi:MAG: hypothetical protein JO166_20365 [Deltaproteobacteria bacterium]|nr:hypothetical protein [Deltaproteobacteria bacterium]